MNKFFPVAAATVGFLVGSKFTDRFETQKWKAQFREAKSQVSASKGKYRQLQEKLQEKEVELKAYGSIVADTNKKLDASKNLDWDYDFDGRKGEKPKVNRVVFLVRHGQYHDREKTDEKRTLTELGKEQAKMTGEYLKQCGFNFDKIYVSTMTRARETGEIIAENFPDVPIEYSDTIREAFPAPPRPALEGWEIEDDPDHPFEMARMKQGYDLIIKRANLDSEKTEAILVVCHGNVIRSFCCRALQVPVERWLNLSVDNGSISIIRCSKSGETIVERIGECGYMPVDKITYNLRPRSNFQNILN